MEITKEHYVIFGCDTKDLAVAMFNEDSYQLTTASELRATMLSSLNNDPLVQKKRQFFVWADQDNFDQIYVNLVPYGVPKDRHGYKHTYQAVLNLTPEKVRIAVPVMNQYGYGVEYALKMISTLLQERFALQHGTLMRLEKHLTGDKNGDRWAPRQSFYKDLS